MILYEYCVKKKKKGVIEMAQATLSIRVDSDDKKKFETFCNETGMNVSVAVNMFMKKVIREQKIPKYSIFHPSFFGLPRFRFEAFELWIPSAYWVTPLVFQDLV